MSIELYLVVNLLADGAILGAASRALGLRNRPGLVAGASIALAYAVLAAARPRPFAALPFQLVVLALVSRVVSLGYARRVWLRAAAFIAGGALLAGGASLMPSLALRGPSALPCALLGAALLTAVFALKRPLDGEWQVRLRVDMDGRRVRFPALIDTGNRLREPISGEPVVIAEPRLFGDALPASGWRELRYGAVGGSGRMRCFKPTALWIERGRRRSRAPQVWIALSPGPLPGSARALAPSEFACFV